MHVSAVSPHHGELHERRDDAVDAENPPGSAHQRHRNAGNLERMKTSTLTVLSALFVLCLVALSNVGRAQSERAPVLVGTVIRVIDGDTIQVQLQSGPIKVRFDSIDAPEHDQPHGAEATAALTKLVLNHEVQLEVVTQDRYERLVAVVSVGGVNINQQLVQDGHAWAYRFFLKDREFCRWEDRARREHLGLWALSPTDWIYPSDWRRLQKQQITASEDFSHETVDHCLQAVGVR